MQASRPERTSDHASYTYGTHSRHMRSRCRKQTTRPTPRGRRTETRRTRRDDFVPNLLRGGVPIGEIPKHRECQQPRGGMSVLRNRWLGAVHWRTKPGTQTDPSAQQNCPLLTRESKAQERWSRSTWRGAVVDEEKCELTEPRRRASQASAHMEEVVRM